MRLASSTLGKIGFIVLVVTAGAGCAGSLTPPFDAVKNQPMMVYRLQNYEPPAAQPQAAPGAPIPGLPPQLQALAQQALTNPFLKSLLPPGILPGTTPAAPASNAPRFENVVILSTAQVADSSQKDEIAGIFGHESNFTDKYENCFFPELGFSMQQGSGQFVNVLVSVSCQQVKIGQGGVWPYGTKIGLTADALKKIAEIQHKAFGG